MRQIPVAVAIISFLAGVAIWFGGACYVLSAGDDDGNDNLEIPSLPTQQATPAPTPTPTPLPDRVSCEEIRGTEYRSEAERQWFFQNCRAPP